MFHYCCCLVVAVWWLFSDSLQSHGRQRTRLPSPSLSFRVCSDSCPLSQWCNPAISSSVALFSSWSFPASGSFPKSWLFISGGQSVGASASGSVLPVNIQNWFPLGLTGLISQESSQAPQFEIVSSSTLSFHYGPTRISIHDYWKTHSFDYMDFCRQRDVCAFNMLSRFVSFSSKKKVSFFATLFFKLKNNCFMEFCGFLSIINKNQP